MNSKPIEKVKKGKINPLLIVCISFTPPLWLVKYSISNAIGTDTISPIIDIIRFSTVGGFSNAFKSK